MAKQRILALHGYTQTAESFRRVLSLSFLPRLSHLVDCVFIDAPHHTKEALGGGCWWHPSQNEQPEGSGSKRWVYDGWEQSLELLRHVDVTQGPFDGVLGFSQGACVTSALAAQHSHPDGTPAVRFGFGIMVGGFAYRGQGAGPLFRHRPLRTPSLHVYGKRDKIVSPKSSEDLASLFDSPAVHAHTGGHAFPQTDASLEFFAEFIRAQGT